MALHTTDRSAVNRSTLSYLIHGNAMHVYGSAPLPADGSFILQMAPSLVERLRDNGWSDNETLFLEIPFATMGSGGPIAVGLALAKDYSRRVFYKSLMACTGAIESLSDRQLQVVVAHELDEIGEHLREAREDALDSPMRAPGEEEARHKPLMDRLEARFGGEPVHDAVQAVSLRAAAMPALRSEVFLFWLNYFVASRSDDLAGSAQVMLPEMMSSRARQNFIRLIVSGMEMYQARPSGSVEQAAAVLLSPFGTSRR